MKSKQTLPLSEQFISLDPVSLPTKISHIVDKYKNIKNAIRNNVTSHIEEGSATSKENGKYTLTQHNFKHFDRVISVATDLLKVSKFILTPYEQFMLLVAIEIHDIGNILGRTNHENSLEEVFFDIVPRNQISILNDGVENKIFLDIAKSHSGKIDGNKDRINLLLPKPIIQHNHESLRVHILAALLRLADELSEDSERAKSYLLLKEKVDHSSEIYHVYAQAISSCIISAHQHKVNIIYNFTKDRAINKFNKDGKEKYLLDEIFERNIKTHLERIYCNKFLPQNYKFTI